jgi:membrane protein YqaA with SNARE-associated domain
LHWLSIKLWLLAHLPALGGVGVLSASFIDSSFIPLPLLTDLSLMELSSLHPMRMPYYVAMAAIGSAVGCTWIYFLARKGGQAYYWKSQGDPSGKIRRLTEQYPWACVFLPAVAPFPVPFKPFVIAQGVFQVPFPRFVVGTLLGRGLLFFMEGCLAARYGSAAKQFVMDQKWAAAAVILTIGAAILLIRRFSWSNEAQRSQMN